MNERHNPKYFIFHNQKYQIKQTFLWLTVIKFNSFTVVDLLLVKIFQVFGHWQANHSSVCSLVIKLKTKQQDVEIKKWMNLHIGMLTCKICQAKKTPKFRYIYLFIEYASMFGNNSYYMSRNLKRILYSLRVQRNTNQWSILVSKLIVTELWYLVLTCISIPLSSL